MKDNVTLPTPEASELVSTPFGAEKAAELSDHTLLDNAEARLAGIMDAAMDAIITIDSRHRIVFFNRAAEEMFRCTAESILGKPLDLLIPERFREDHSGHIDAFGRTGITSRSMAGTRDIYALRADGDEFPAEASISQLDGGEQKLYTVIMRDVTSRVLARQEIERQTMLLDLAPVIIFTLDWRIASWNAGAERLYGWSAQEAIGKFAYKLLDTIYPEPRQKVIDDFFVNGSWQGDLAHLKKNGERVIVASNLALHHGPDGKPLEILALNIDITERKRAEYELIESEKRYKRLFAESPYPMWVFDRETLQFLEVNEAAIRQYGFTRDEFLSMTIKDIRPVEDLPRFLESTRQLSDQLSANEVWRHKRKDGQVMDVEINAHSITFDGRPGRLVLAYDITERRMLEEQLRQSQKMEAIGMLAGGIAHDFNNLLTAISGYTELSLRKLKPDDPIRKNLEEVAKAGDRAAMLTHQLLAFSRKQVLQPTVLDLNSVITELEKMLRRLIGDNIILESKPAEDLWLTKADAGQIDQIIMNLAINARDAMPHGGRLAIETRNIELDENYAASHLDVTPGDYVMLAVSDTGVGMSPEVRDKVFDPFFTTKEAGKGTGLGLSTVYGIVQQSGGTIWVYSEPGYGTTFKIFLPRVVDDEDAIHRTEPKEIPNGTETVLIAEDAEQVRMLTASVLELYGYNVIEASDGEEALRHCSEHGGSIDLLVTDVVMPGMSGTELAQQINRQCPDVKVLYISGYTDDTIVHRGVLEPGTSFLQKPFTAEVLARKVRSVLDGSL
jgi:two-component system cell cycle sensor histidine kinase/response regulator CckA